MEIVFPDQWPERLAWLTALATIIVGLGLMLVPVRFMRFLGLEPLGSSGKGISEVRGAFGGSWVGIGVACILLAQPFTYFALGLAFFFAVVGRLISFVFDRSFNMHCVVATLVETLGAVFPLYFAGQAFGLL